jgi:hypothetical protein
MAPKLVFFLMVLIIVVLWYGQKILAKKSENYNSLERMYFEDLQKFLNKEISKEQLLQSAQRFFSLNGADEKAIAEKVEKDLAIHEM